VFVKSIGKTVIVTVDFDGRKQAIQISLVELTCLFVFSSSNSLFGFLIMCLVLFGKVSQTRLDKSSAYVWFQFWRVKYWFYHVWMDDL